MSTRPLAAVAAISCCLLLPAVPAAAQGKGHGNAVGHAKSTASAPVAVSSGSGGGVAEPSGVRNFASWLDDASIVTPGSGVMSFSAGYWRMADFSELDAPSFDVGFGITKRVQAGASVPVYHASATGGPVSRGLGDLYLNSKIQLREPAGGNSSRVGIALVPLVQILSADPGGGISRVSWGLPVALEFQGDGWRTYGSAGYFSRGSVFGSVALEAPVAERVWITGTVTQSQSIKDDTAADALGLSSSRTDISGGAAWALSNGVALFGSMGRTLSRSNPTDTHLFVNGGLSIAFSTTK